jgi:putative membrane protein
MLMDYGNMMDGGGGWWVWGTLLMVVAIAVVALVVWLIVRNPRADDRPSSSARDILSERYARGEIDSEEYEERLRKLQQ